MSVTITNDNERTLIELYSPCFDSKSIKTYNSGYMTVSFENEIYINDSDVCCESIIDISHYGFNMDFRFLNEYEDNELYKLLHSLKDKCFRVYISFDNKEIEIEDVCTLYENAWLNNTDICPLFSFTYKKFCQDNKFKSVLYELEGFKFKNKDLSIKILLID